MQNLWKTTFLHFSISSCLIFLEFVIYTNLDAVRIQMTVNLLIRIVCTTKIIISNLFQLLRHHQIYSTLRLCSEFNNINLLLH